MPQTSYSFAPSVATAGLIAEAREAVVVISKVASGLVPVGLLCAPGADSLVGPPQATVDQNSTNPGQVIALPAGIVANPISNWLYTGIPIYDSSRPPYDVTLGYPAYSNQDPVPVLVKGPIWVNTEGAMTSESNPVYVRVAVSGALTMLGAFAFAAGTGLVQLANARWRSADNTSGLAILELW